MAKKTSPKGRSPFGRLIVLFLTLIFFPLTLQPVNALSLQDFANTPAQKEQRELNRIELFNVCQKFYQDKLDSGLKLAPSLIRDSLNRVLPPPKALRAFGRAGQISSFLDPIISRLSAINNLLSQIKSTLQSLGDLKQKPLSPLSGTTQ